MAKKKKPTPLQLEYRKQIKRLNQAIRRAEKRGYLVPENIIPAKPKRITKKAVEKLKKITPNDIYKKSDKVDIETGELIPGEIARRIERSESAKKAARTRAKKRNPTNYEPNIPYVQGGTYEEFPNEADIIISNFRAELTRFPEVAQPIVNNWLNRVIRDYGKEEVAKMLEEASANGIGIDYSIAYRADLIMDRLAEILDLLPGASVGNKQDIMDALEYEEDWELPD